MQRSIAITLLLIFCSLPGAPLLATSSDQQSNLPACCRRGGDHHGMMGMTGMERDGSERDVSRLPDKCPSCPPGILPITTQGHFFAPPSGGIFYAALLSHPACALQTEAQYRISFDRSRQKRGPPLAVRLS